MALEFHESEGDIFIYIRKLMSKMGSCVYKILTRAYRNDCSLSACLFPQFFLVYDGAYEMVISTLTLCPSK